MKDIKNNIVVVGVIALVLGACIGYVAGRDNDRRDHWGERGGYGYNLGYGMHDAMGGMMMGLSGRTGDDLDHAFLEGMIMHHQGAISMSEALLKNTKRPELIKLGNDIIAAQTKEIEMMKDWETGWFK